MKESNNIRGLLAHYSCKVARHHLVMGALGNISARDKSEVWIKRGGAWMERATASDFIKARPKNKSRVSKEVNLHLGCYKARPDIRAIIHTHPFIATAVGTVLARKGEKKYNTRMKIAIIKYYIPGSMALARAVQKAIKASNAVIMANHGLVTVGRNLREAYHKEHCK